MDTVLIGDAYPSFAPAPARYPGGAPGARVLVADDDPGIADLLTDLLEGEGHRVRTAADGCQALDGIARDPVDVVVADVMMPRLDGVALIDTLRGRGDRTPVVLMSAVYADVDIPGVRFVPKPFDLAHLVDVVNLTVAEARQVAADAGRSVERRQPWNGETAARPPTWTR